MVEFQRVVVSRWSLVVSQFVRQLWTVGQRPFLACPERSEGTNNQRRGSEYF